MEPALLKRLRGPIRWDIRRMRGSSMEECMRRARPHVVAISVYGHEVAVRAVPYGWWPSVSYYIDRQRLTPAKFGDALNAILADGPVEAYYYGA